MISLTGNEDSAGELRCLKRRGFTFFEVMVTVVVFSLGLVMIHKAMLLSFDYQQHLTNRLFAKNYLDHQATRIQYLFKSGAALPKDLNGSVHAVRLNKRLIPFRLSVSMKPLNTEKDFYEMEMTLSWPERSRTARLSRSAYLSYF